MNKKEFITELELRIKKYPDYKEIIAYYDEVIQDKIDMNYMTEEEAVASLGSLNEICRNIDEQRSQVKDERIEEVKVAVKEEAKQEVKQEPKRMSGGKKFVYVLWTIATVLMAIVSITILIGTILLMVESIVGMAISATILPTSIAMAGFCFGAGLFVFGFSIVAIHYAKVLVKFIFKSRPKWNKQVRKGLAGE